MPGSVGGAVRMNAGGHGSDMAASLTGVRVFDCRTGEDSRVPASALDLGYRRSSIAPHQVVLEAHPWAHVAYLPQRPGVLAWLRHHLRPGDLCLTLGAGDLTTVPDEVMAALRAS